MIQGWLFAKLNIMWLGSAEPPNIFRQKVKNNHKGDTNEPLTTNLSFRLSFQKCNRTSKYFNSFLFILEFGTKEQRTNVTKGKTCTSINQGMLDLFCFTRVIHFSLFVPLSLNYTNQIKYILGVKESLKLGIQSSFPYMMLNLSN